MRVKFKSGGSNQYVEVEDGFDLSKASDKRLEELLDRAREGVYPPTPIKGYILLGPNLKQGTRRGWWVFADDKEGRVPVTIVAGHEEVRDD